MRSSSLLSVLTLAATIVSPALATQSGGPERQAPSVSGVTVSPGAKPDALVDPTSQFVRQHLPESAFSEQYPRFRDAVCVKVQGLPDEFNAFVAKRIVEVAKQVKAPLAASPDCTPNIHVIFTPAPQAQIDDIAKRKDILLGFHWQADLKRVSTASQPIQGWYVTRVRDFTGRGHIELSGIFGADLDGSDDKPRGGGSTGGSRLSNGMSTEIVHTLIVADANKVADEKIGAVADYVSVLALARWKGLEHCNSAVSTVLNLMADGCDRNTAPEQATTADLALLTSLYAVDPRESGPQQRASIASAMRAADKTH